MLLTPKSIALIALLSTVANQPTFGFWFTDTSLFQPQPIQVQQSVAQSPSQPPAKAQDETKSVASASGKLAKLSLEKGEVPATGTWIRLGDQPSECSCNLDWIQNQTSSWINKWLRSADGLAQMRLLLSNSTGATGDINRLGERSSSSNNNNNNSVEAKRAAGRDSASASTVNHWMPRSKGNNERPTNGKRHQANAQSRHSRAHGLQLGADKLIQGPRGPQGPKGDTGSRGERGEKGDRGEPGSPASSLLRVKDRDALFDLGSQQPQNSSGLNNNSNNNLVQLVFVEAEQMLVVRTNFGWRPVQLDPVLIDFRKTIGKFSITSDEQRRKLISGNKDELLNNQHAQHSTRANIDRRVMSTSRNGAKLFAGHSKSTLNSNDIIVNDIDEDDDDDDEDDDIENDVDVNKGYVIEEDDDDDEDDDDEYNESDDADDDLSIVDDISKVLSTVNVRPSSGINELAAKLPEATRAKSVDSRKSPVAARSAAAALVSASIENSPSADSALTIAPDTTASPVRTGNGGGGGQMRLRLVALDEPFSGNIHGIRGADFKCKRNAAKANIKGSFRAFLASGFQNLNEIVRQHVHKHPVVNMRDEILADSWHDLFKRPTRIGNPLGRIYSFDGRHVAADSKWPNKLVWHGASNKMGHRDLNHNCDGWHSDSLSKFGFATPLHLPRTRRRQRKRHLVESGNQANETGLLLEVIDKYPCRMPLVMLCIETIGQQIHFTKSIHDINADVESNLVVS